MPTVAVTENRWGEDIEGQGYTRKLLSAQEAAVLLTPLSRRTINRSNQTGVKVLQFSPIHFLRSR